MLQELFSNFIRAWLLGAIALLIGRYVGSKSKQLPVFLGPKVMTYVKAWAATFIGQLAFTYLGLGIGLKDHIQSGFAEFLLPLIVGSYFAHILLVRQSAHR